MSNFPESEEFEGHDIPQKKLRPGPKRIDIIQKPLAFPPPVSATKKHYTTRYKLRVISYLHHATIPTGPTSTRPVTSAETARRFKIPRSNITRWIKCEKELQDSLGTQQRNRVGKRRWPKMERPLHDGFIEQRKAGKFVRRGWFRSTSKALMSVHYLGVIFRFSNGWFSGFLSWYNISLRMTTNKASKVPADSYSAILSWAHFNRRNSQLRQPGGGGNELGDEMAEVGRYHLASICNMDQTPLPFEFLSGQTYEPKGSKTVWVKGGTSGWDKRQATLQLTIFADGEMRVLPLIFFKGKGTGMSILREKTLYDPHVIVKFNPTGYANSENMEEWIEEQLVPALNCKPALLVLDLFAGHKTDNVLDAFKAHDITLSIIPAGCTGIIQPLDISINRPFKDILKVSLSLNDFYFYFSIYFFTYTIVKYIRS
ncbi:hypothetical protein L873DRAFT_1758859 [Choiromyces venosus 120613-1]|uniref:HTH CENPB-type domain-containing protein n=1 Tax=Choiromyces venosus 120613-1 TaxID=1336337 RepID=A0A3N4K595_9PEZI|nr:hypothetical protein L873DRAFT_1758859 [Choiromyces venosus 120613-1]